MPKKTLSKTSQTTTKRATNPSVVKNVKAREGIKEEIIEKLNTLPDVDRAKIFQEMGVGGDVNSGKYYTCYLCGNLKDRRDFYSCSDVRCKSKVSRICKECCERIVYNKNEFDIPKPLEKKNLFEVLEYLDKPFTNDLFNTAISEARLGNIGREDYWKTYIVGVCRLATYKTQRWKDSDKDALISRTGETDLIDSSGNLNDIHANIENNLEISETYKNNKNDVLKFVGYDPFENYPVETDKPLLYAQLVNFLDEECKNDGMKLAAIIQIVKKLNQAEKLNDAIDRYINDYQSMDSNQAVINKMADTSSKLMSIVNSLAKENGIAVNHNNNKSKGANTFSGKIKELRRIGLRSAEINAFDIGTCEGMKQVAEISEAARHKQIGYDEQIANEIKDIKVQLVEELTREKEKAVEMARKLLVENKDLKDYMIEIGIMNKDYELIT